jgi:hypothetical protein
MVAADAGFPLLADRYGGSSAPVDRAQMIWHTLCQYVV